MNHISMYLLPAAIILTDLGVILLARIQLKLIRVIRYLMSLEEERE